VPTLLQGAPGGENRRARNATDLGYADAYHFSKSFKRLIGVSPSHYRKGIGQIWRATDGGPAWE